jgi:hypothetical protein
MGRFEDIGEQDFIGANPCYGRQTTNGTEDAFVKTFFQDDGDQTSKKALDEVENIIDGWAYFPDGFKNVRMENHFPLDPSLGCKKGAGVHR